MSYPRFGTYQAVVTDNSEFYKRGYIRVRISAFYSGVVEWDLSVDYDDTQFKKSLKDDIKCLVYMPIGGGNGHGMFTLPQVNSTGVVSFIDGNINKALWMGSFVEPKFDRDGNFKEANVPNDYLTAEGPGTCGITVDGKNIEASGGAVIIRQKSNGSGDSASMVWDNQRTENLIVLEENALIINHASKWDESNNSIVPEEYQEISIIKNTDDTSENKGVVTINIKTYITNSDSSVDEYGIEIIEKEVSIVTKNNTGNRQNSIVVNEEDITMTSYNTNSKKKSTVEISPTEATLTNSGSIITVSEDEINVDGGKKLTLSGDTVLLGGLAEEHVVTSNIPFSYRMEDGTILSSSNVAKA